jgi:uncharacterized oxidoreductase
MQLTNNTILITGGTSGIGYEFTKQLLDLKNTVIITGRNATKLQELKARHPEVHTVQSDVSDPEAIASLNQEILARFPNLNILINNAGEMRRINLQDPVGVKDITREIDINLCGPIRMIQQFLPHLANQKSAAIINVSSGLALVPFPLSPIYGATKAGLHSYSQSLRVQLKNTGIKVFELVAPGAKTPLNDKFANDIESISLMDVDKLVNVAIRGIQADKMEIYPGLARVIKVLSRLAPQLIFGQMAKLAQKAYA